MCGDIVATHIQTLYINTEAQRLNARAVVNLQHRSPPGLHSAKWERMAGTMATVFDNTIELTGCVSGRPCSMAGSSILFLGSTCALGETLGGLWEREEGGERVRRSMEAHRT